MGAIRSTSVGANLAESVKSEAQKGTSADDSTLPVRQYDKNLGDSDDSSDEEVLIRTGNVPRKWYELYDH